jgi:dienelactone hydrolase
LRSLYLLAVLLLALFVTGCKADISELPESSAPGVSEQVNITDSDAVSEIASASNDMLSLVEDYKGWVLAGEYQKAFDMSDEKLKSLFGSIENMEIALKAVLKQTGAFIKSDSPITEENGAKKTYTFPSDFEAGEFNIVVAVEEGKVCSFGIVPGGGSAPNINEEAKQNGPAPSDDLPPGVAEIDIIINKNEAHELYGKLAYPSDAAGPIPAVVLVHGSGPHDMDETIAQNKPFKDIAYALAAQGIAVLRYNKVTYAYPENAGEFSLSVDAETVNDAVAAKTALLEQSGMAFSKVYVAGHSLGGMMAPRIARQGSYDGMVLLAGSTRGFIDILYDQGQYMLPLMNLPGEQLDAQLAEYERLRTEALETMKLPTSELEGRTIFGFPAAYVHSISNPSIKQDIEELNRPMLILQGSKDFQVYANKDFALYKEITEGLSDVTMKEYEGLNHLFMPSFMEQPDTTEYNQPAKVDNQVLLDIAEWILSRT